MAILKALSSKGFLRAVFWSFLSWLTAWGIAALALPEVKQLFGQYGWLIPAINSFLVLCKQGAKKRTFVSNVSGSYPTAKRWVSASLWKTSIRRIGSHRGAI